MKRLLHCPIWQPPPRLLRPLALAQAPESVLERETLPQQQEQASALALGLSEVLALVVVPVLAQELA